MGIRQHRLVLGYNYCHTAYAYMKISSCSPFVTLLKPQPTTVQHYKHSFQCLWKTTHINTTRLKIDAARRDTATATHNALKVVFTTIFPFIKFIHDENCFRHKTTRQLFSYFGISVMAMMMIMIEKKYYIKVQIKQFLLHIFAQKFLMSN